MCGMVNNQVVFKFYIIGVFFTSTRFIDLSIRYTLNILHVKTTKKL